VLGNGETCTGDAARRAGNEFVYQGLAQQNVATLTEAKVKQVVTTCAHCFNTLKNEYRDFGLELEVVHHTQLLNRLVRDGRLTPVADGAGAAKRSITYHDPCFLGRHNQVYSPPRELLQVLPGAEYVEMERSAERSFCCGAGGARMWMEERIGERINENRTREAVATGADQIAVGCPFCRVMLDDGLTSAQSKGEAGEAVEVLDVAQMLLASVKGVPATRARAGVGAGAGTGPGPAVPPEEASTVVEEAPRPPETEPAEAKQSGSLFDDDGGSLFGDLEEEAEERGEEPPPPAAKAAAATGSLFGDGASLFDTPVEEETPAPPAATAVVGSTIPEGTSLFDVGVAEPEPPQVEPAPDQTSEPALGSEIPEGTSLFDLGDPEAGPAPVAAPAVEATDWEVGHDIPEGQSLFDVDRPDPAELSRQATAAASDDPETILDADDEPEGEPEPEAKPKPAPSGEPSGETNTPRTDADINQSGSLFDL
jgi:Cysteine-rich domain